MSFTHTFCVERKSLSDYRKHGLPMGWFAVSWRLFNDTDTRKLTGKIFRISTSKGSIYRTLRFSADAITEDPECSPLYLDYDGWLKLDGYRSDASPKIENVTITQCTKIRSLGAILTYPDPVQRLIGWVSLISVIVGLISLGLGLLALYLSMFFTTIP